MPTYHQSPNTDASTLCPPFTLFNHIFRKGNHNQPVPTSSNLARKCFSDVVSCNTHKGTFCFAKSFMRNKQKRYSKKKVNFR